MGENKGSNKTEFHLKLFVSGASPNSVKAIYNLKEICEKYIKGDYNLEIIDIHQDAALAAREQIIALPLLIRKFPLPERKLIGDMSDVNKVLIGLGIKN